MEGLKSIKEKIAKLKNDIDELQISDISEIEKDIILTDLRSLYQDIKSLNTPEKIDEVSNDTPKEIKEEKIIEPNNDDKIKKSDNTEQTTAENTEPEASNVNEATDTDINLSEPSLDQADATENESKITENRSNELEFELNTESVVNENKNEDTQTRESIEQDLFSNKPDNRTIGDELNKNSQSLNEKFSKIKSDINAKINLSPLSDIKAGIGLGDRFLYIKELFNGDNELFENTISRLNELNSMEEALEFLDKNFNWDTEDETLITFLNVVKRKYL